MFSFGNDKQPKTVDSVLGAFRTAIADLNEVAENHVTEAEAQLRIADEATAKAKAANAEAKRANTIAAQMAAVFN